MKKRQFCKNIKSDPIFRWQTENNTQKEIWDTFSPKACKEFRKSMIRDEKHLYTEKELKAYWRI